MVTKLTQKVFFFFKVLKLGPAMNLRQLNSSEALSVSRLSLLIPTARHGKNSSWVCRPLKSFKWVRLLQMNRGRGSAAFHRTLFSNTVS